MPNAFVAAMIAVLLIGNTADCLSDAICDSVEADWQSDEPRLEGQFPFYTLMGKLLARGCPKLVAHLPET